MTNNANPPAAPAAPAGPAVPVPTPTERELAERVNRGLRTLAAAERDGLELPASDMLRQAQQLLTFGQRLEPGFDHDDATIIAAFRITCLRAAEQIVTAVETEITQHLQ